MVEFILGTSNRSFVFISTRQTFQTNYVNVLCSFYIHTDGSQASSSEVTSYGVEPQFSLTDDLPPCPVYTQTYYHADELSFHCPSSFRRIIRL